MMCPEHSTDLSNGVGVCASCLRHRLIVIFEAQKQAHQQFPKSVSPCVSSRRRSESASSLQLDGHQQCFYNAPPVKRAGLVNVEAQTDKKSGAGRFSSIFMGIIRSKLGKGRVSNREVSAESCASSHSSQSWLSNILPGRREKQVPSSSLDDDAIEVQGKSEGALGRGIPPGIFSNSEDKELRDRVGSSRCSSESSQNWKRTPTRTPAVRLSRGKTATHYRNVTATSLAFCLSPLVLVGPNRNLSQKVAPPEMKASICEGRVMRKQHLHNPAPAVFGKNRSWKLVDLGK